MRSAWPLGPLAMAALVLGLAMPSAQALECYRHDPACQVYHLARDTVRDVTGLRVEVNQTQEEPGVSVYVEFDKFGIHHDERVTVMVCTDETGVWVSERSECTGPPMVVLWPILP